MQGLPSYRVKAQAIILHPAREALKMRPFRTPVSTGKQVRARVDHNGCPLFRHFRTMTAHVAPLGNHWTKSLRGRQPCQSSIMLAKLKVLDPILWSTLHFSTPLRPNHRRHTFTTAATVCLGCGLSLDITCETYNLHWALGVTCTIEMFVTPSSTHVVLFIH